MLWVEILMEDKVQDPLIGQTIDGYQIEKLLGQGGMARVYRALDLTLQRYAAFKVVNASSHHSKVYEERFYREARSIAKLNHPNIVSVYRFSEASNMFYMAMEYVDGADLHWVLQDYQMDGDFMDYDTMLNIMQQVSDALDFAHKHGVIHRDIKPSNIMISRDGRAILTDFGLALDVAEGTQGEIFGSPHYIAPEQAIDSKTVKPQTDGYSLGVILFEILVGIVPYYEGTTFEIAMKHISEPLPDPHLVNPKLHPAFIPILKKVMAKDIDKRYPTCNDMMLDLRAAVAKATNTAQPTILETKSQPAQRIALKIAPLPTPSVPEPVKPPTLIARNPDDSSASIPLSPSELASPVKPPRRSRRSRVPLLVASILLVIISVVSYGAVDYYDIKLSDIPSFGGSSANNSANSAIEGRVMGISGRTVTIYDMAVLLDANEPLLDIPRDEILNRTLRIEGRYEITDSRVEFTKVTSFLVDNTPVEEEE
jgi:eukaryotic-like serine/threonine-protein kinase